MQKPFYFKGNVHAVAIVGMTLVIIASLAWLYIRNLLAQPILISSDTSTSQASSYKSISGDPQVRLEQLYAKYLLEIKSSTSKNLVQKYVDDGTIVENFMIYPSSDPLLCGNDAIPDRVSVRLVTKSSSQYVFYVTKLYSNGQDASMSITATMSANKDNTWALASVKCV